LVELRPVAEAERRVPRLELLRTLEEADDIADRRPLTFLVSEIVNPGNVGNVLTPG
jgi:hypothetical protein